jgi:hypothetical protein
MIKNERDMEIPTRVGLTKFIPHFTTIECSVFSNVTGRVAFMAASYDILRIQYGYTVDVATRSYNYNIGNSVAIAKEEKISWNK